VTNPRSFAKAARSDVRLSLRRPRAAFGRVTAEIAPPPVPEQVLFAWPGRYGLRLGELGGRWLMQSAFDGAFLIARDASTIHIVCETLPPRPDLIDVLVRRVLPRVMILAGATAIHAAGLSDGQGSLVLTGPSGAGKSTLCAALAHIAGWDIYSDDISVYWPGDPPMLAPATTGVCVWPQSREGLALPLDECRAMPGYDGKVRYEPGVDRVVAPVPLRGFIFLNRSPDCDVPRLDPMTLAEAVSETLIQIIRFNPQGSQVEERMSALRSVSAAMRVAPPLRLTYPADYAALPEVTEVLRTAIQS
jgi:hypothetical protein